MEMLAKEIYDSTPRIVECKYFQNYELCCCIEFPKHLCKILANKKEDKDDEKGQLRASLFLSSESVKLIKHGRIQNKDLAIEVCA